MRAAAAQFGPRRLGASRVKSIAPGRLPRLRLARAACIDIAVVLTLAHSRRPTTRSFEQAARSRAGPRLSSAFAALTTRSFTNRTVSREDSVLCVVRLPSPSIHGVSFSFFR